MSRNLKAGLAAGVACAVLAACGGGGSTDSPYLFAGHQPPGAGGDDGLTIYVPPGEDLSGAPPVETDPPPADDPSPPPAEAEPPPADAAPPPPPPPPAAPPPPPPPPVNTANPAPGGIKPILAIEKDADGTTYLRVQEQIYDAFAGSQPERVIKDQKWGPAPGSNYVLKGTEPTLLSNIDIVRMKHGITLQGSGKVSIQDYTYTQFDGAGSIHGSAIKLGDHGTKTDGPTYINRVVADGMQKPDATYKIANNDFIGIEFDASPIFIRDVTGKNFGDAGIDSKSSDIYIMNATLSSANRILRAWGDVEIVVVNSIINAAPGYSQGWVWGSGKIKYYNTLWCEGADEPSPSHPKCKYDPWIVQGEDMTREQAATHFERLSENPLGKVDGLFKTNIDEIFVEYSVDGGKSWRPLSLPNTGGPGAAPVGDPRFKLPLNLDTADHRFRATYKKNGAVVGTSAVIDETSSVVS